MSIKILRRFYWLFLATTSVILLATPFVIKEGISIFREEVAEAGIILATFYVAYNAERLYRLELERKTEIVDDVVRHTGRINRLMSTIESVLSHFYSIPQNSTTASKLIKNISQELLNSTEGDWVLVRIITTSSGRTLAESLSVRKGKEVLNLSISNKELLAQTLSKETISARSTDTTSPYVVCCIAHSPTSTSLQKRVFQIAANLLHDSISRNQIYGDASVPQGTSRDS